MTKSLHTNNYASFLDLLIRARKEAKVTQDEVAERLHRPQFFVSKYENGERRVAVIEFLEIAEAIGFDQSVSFAKLRPIAREHARIIEYL